MRRVLTSKIFLIVIVAAVVVVGMAVGRAMLQNRLLAREVAALQAEAAGLEEKNAEFFELLKRFQTDSFIEREARLKLNLQKPGEVVYVIGRSDGRAASATPASRPRAASNLDRWREYFFPSGAEAGPAL
jgi:cell division protein FtsB